MKELIIIFTAWLGAVVAVVSFWVWLSTLLSWKIFAVIGASSLIYLICLLIGYLFATK